MKTAHEDKVEGSPQSAVEAMGKVLALTKKDTASLMDGLLATIGQAGYAGQPVTRATMVNAVTAVAHQADADSVDDWQKLGGRVLDLPRSDWQRVAMAALHFPSVPRHGGAFFARRACDSPTAAMVRRYFGRKSRLLKLMRPM